jgi:hypothetical protein
VAAVEIAGIKKLKIYNTANTKMFKHPKYYKNLRKLARLRNRDQAISLQAATADARRTPGTGLNKKIRLLTSLQALKQGGGWAPSAQAHNASKRSGVKRCANQQALDMIPIIDGHRLRAVVVFKQIEDR